MATQDNLNIKVGLETSGVSEGIDEVKTKVSELEKILSDLGDENPFLKVLGKKGELSGSEGLFDNLADKGSDPTETISAGEKEALNSIEGIEEILLSKLEEAIQALRTALETQGFSEEEIERQVEFVRKLGEKRIDDVIEDFTDTLDKAVKDVSKKVADAFVDMALKGEFSIKTIGDIFLKTFLDIIAQELIQKPLEDILGSIVSAAGSFLGSATGGEIEAGVPTFINEQGQEIFIPHTPGKIVNADQTRQMFSQGQGVVINQNLSFDAAIKNDMVGTILQASPLIVEQTKIAVLESLQGRRI